MYQLLYPRYTVLCHSASSDDKLEFGFFSQRQCVYAELEAVRDPSPLPLRPNPPQPRSSLQRAPCVEGDEHVAATTTDLRPLPTRVFTAPFRRQTPPARACKAAPPAEKPFTLRQNNHRPSCRATELRVEDENEPSLLAWARIEGRGAVASARGYWILCSREETFVGIQYRLLWNKASMSALPSFRYLPWSLMKVFVCLVL